MARKWCGHGKHFVNTKLFHKKGEYLQPNCKKCQNGLNRKRYKKNSKSHIQHVIQNSRERAMRFREWKITLSCQVCPENYWQCLDFHHLDPSKKDLSISEGAYQVGKAKLLAELEKCVVLCKNCHTKVHGSTITLPANISGCTAKFGAPWQ